jgi:hypothetical protein
MRKEEQIWIGVISAVILIVILSLILNDDDEIQQGDIPFYSFPPTVTNSQDMKHVFIYSDVNWMNSEQSSMYVSDTCLNSSVICQLHFHDDKEFNASIFTRYPMTNSVSIYRFLPSHFQSSVESNLTLSYHRGSDVSIGTVPGSIDFLWSKHILPFDRRYSGYIYVYTEKCTEEIRIFLDDLSRFFRIQIYGECDKSKPYEEEDISYYKFALIIQEHSCDDNVSPIFWNALAYRVIPIIYGPSNIQYFAPTSHSVLNANHYQNGNDLIDEIYEFEKNDTKFHQFTDFSQLKESFLSLFHKESWTQCGLSKLCNAIAYPETIQKKPTLKENCRKNELPTFHS